MGDRFGLCEPALVTARLVRGYGIADGEWRRQWNRRVLAEPRVGMVIGYRTLANGRQVLSGRGACFPESFVREETLPAALVVFDLRSNPVYVLLTDLHSPHALVFSSRLALPPAPDETKVA